jgi:pyrimidine-nucleoside phosphorylase/thymidine phosphorylase
MRAVDMIRKKRDNHPLDDAEIRFLVAGLADGHVADYQWSALLMAIVWRGMDSRETATLTDAMMKSGIVAPIAAAAGVPVPMVSGRGLGHTGGTLDKLEAIPGFRVDLDLDRYKKVLNACGLVLIGQTAEIAPADKTLYALRDATATVESIPLISASIMSKKLAEGIDGLVLDVKTGNGAFMEKYEDSLELAETMVAIGRGLGKRMRALITRMDQPLGYAVGNAVEVAESVICLRGEGPADLMELSLELAAEMVVMGGRAATIEEARSLCQKTIDDGRALERFRRVVEAQGGAPGAIDDLFLLPQPKRRIPITADRSGVVRWLAAKPIGQATMLLGAGRARVDSTIDPAVGVVLHKKLGDPVDAGEPLCTLLVNDERALDQSIAMIRHAYGIGDGDVDVPELIVERL